MSSVRRFGVPEYLYELKYMHIDVWQALKYTLKVSIVSEKLSQYCCRRVKDVPFANLNLKFILWRKWMLLSFLTLHKKKVLWLKLTYQQYATRLFQNCFLHIRNWIWEQLNMKLIGRPYLVNIDVRNLSWTNVILYFDELLQLIYICI